MQLLDLDLVLIVLSIIDTATANTVQLYCSRKRPSYYHSSIRSAAAGNAHRS